MHTTLVSFILAVAKLVDCNFDDDLCNWSALSGDLTLRLGIGSTPLPDTGPSYDHTWANFVGKYLYLGETD